jgi:hypothetical protein
MSFAGLSVLTMILRQMLGGQLTKFDSFVARTWLHLGFMVTLGSILPPLLALFEVSMPMAWRISSGLMAIILGWWALTFPRRRHATNPRLSMQVISFLAAMDLTALALASNAIAVPLGRLASSAMCSRFSTASPSRSAAATRRKSPFAPHRLVDGGNRVCVLCRICANRHGGSRTEHAARSECAWT